MIETAIKAARLAGEKLEYYFETILEKEEKEDQSFVTRADKEADEIIINLIKNNYPSHQIVTEENGTLGESSEYSWVVDPLDGTLNFTRGLPIFATAIAVVKDKKPIIRVVYNPITNSLYTVEKGKGAFWNGEKIEVSVVNNLKDSIVSMGRSRSSDNKEKTLGFYNRFYHELKSQRVLGSSSLELAWVAAGRLEGFIAVGLNNWDFFAGLLLVQESRGRVTDFAGGEWKNSCNHFLASNGRIHKDLLDLINQS